MQYHSDIDKAKEILTLYNGIDKQILSTVRAHNGTKNTVANGTS